MILTILFIISFALLFLWPNIDCYIDYRNIKHLVIWFNWFKDRKYLHYEWAAK